MKTREYRPIVVKGAYGCGNFGDDALMVAVHDVVTRLCPKEGLAYLCPPSAYLHTLLPEAQVLVLPEEASLSAGLLLFGGGTQFFSFPGRGRRRPKSGLATRMIKALKQPHLLPFRVLRQLTREHRKTFPDHSATSAALGVGLGPFVAGCRREAQTKDLFTHMAYVSVRDAKSYETCRHWGVKHLYHHADLCFWPGFHEIHAPVVEPARKPSFDRIGLIVRDWPHDARGDSYHRSLLTVADRLSRSGKTIDFLLFAGQQDQIWLHRLQTTRFRIVAWNPEEDTVGGFVQKLASYDLLVTARYHGAVLATLLGKPSICIEVEPKLSLFAEVLGAAGRCWRYPFDPAECLCLTEEMAAHVTDLTEHLRYVKDQQTVLATEMVETFLGFASQAIMGRTDVAQAS